MLNVKSVFALSASISSLMRCSDGFLSSADADDDEEDDEEDDDEAGSCLMLVLGGT
jgi:hypothetical protein